MNQSSSQIRSTNNPLHQQSPTMRSFAFDDESSFSLRFGLSRGFSSKMKLVLSLIIAAQVACVQASPRYNLHDLLQQAPITATPALLLPSKNQKRALLDDTSNSDYPTDYTLTTHSSICGYINGVPTSAWTPPGGSYCIALETQSAWGVCGGTTKSGSSSTEIVVTSVGKSECLLPVACIDKNSCSDGCGTLTNGNTLTWYVHHHIVFDRE